MQYHVTRKTFPRRYAATVRMRIPAYEAEGMLWDIFNFLIREQRRHPEIVLSQFQIGFGSGAAVVLCLAEAAPFSAEKIPIPGKGQFSGGLQNLIRPAVKFFFGNVKGADIVFAPAICVGTSWLNFSILFLRLKSRMQSWLTSIPSCRRPMM